MGAYLQESWTRLLYARDFTKKRGPEVRARRNQSGGPMDLARLRIPVRNYWFCSVVQERGE